MRYVYRVVLSAEADAAEMLETLEGAGYEVLEVTSKPPSTSTKGSIILAAIQREAEKEAGETVLTRAEIAEEANATVGRVAEIIKEFGDSNDVKAYLERLRTERQLARTAKSAALAQAKLQAKLAAANMAGANDPGTDDEEIVLTDEDQALLTM